MDQFKPTYLPYEDAIEVFWETFTHRVQVLPHCTLYISDKTGKIIGVSIPGISKIVGDEVIRRIEEEYPTIPREEWSKLIERQRQQSQSLKEKDHVEGQGE